MPNQFCGEEIGSCAIDGIDCKFYKLSSFADSCVLLVAGNMRMLCAISTTNDGEFTIVQYKERYYATGKIPGGFNKRELNMSNREIFISRFIDKCIRSIVVSEKTVHVSCTLLSYDKSIDIKSFAVWLCGITISVANIKMKSAVAGVKVYEKGTLKGVVGISEFGITGAEICAAGITNLIPQIQKELPKACAMLEFAEKYLCKYTKQKVTEKLISEILQNYDSEDLWDQIKERIKYDKALFYEIKNGIAEKRGRELRKLSEIRTINAEIGVLPHSNGSAVFYRGKTGALASVVCSVDDRSGLIEENPLYFKKKRFYVHYNFPGYCTGDGNRQSLSRRELGHGKIIYNALKHALQGSKKIVRVVTEILSADGSSSMASVCAASLALRNAGEIEDLICGVSVGMFGNLMVTDLNAKEDELSAMDCKVSGNRAGVTGVHLDTKCVGLSIKDFERALNAGLEGIRVIRNQIE